jgi:hypothetical protein
LGGKECPRLVRRRARSAHLSPKINASVSRCATRRRNAHGIAEYELLYPWHPWAGCLVHIHEVVEKAGGEVFRCSLSGRASARWLEIPAWMFDRAAHAAWRVGAAPYVDIAVLTALATLLHDVRFGRTIAIAGFKRSIRVTRRRFPVGASPTRCMGLSLSRGRTPIWSSFALHSWFDPRREHSSVPTAYFHRRRGAAAVKDGASSAPPKACP